MDTVNAISKRLKTYGIKQMCLSFQIPLLTKDISIDSNTIANHHLLLTGTFLSLRPQFEGISQHHLVKRGVGVRYIYNSGKKGVWFFDVAPFTTKDLSSDAKSYGRIASTIVYSHNFSDRFNLRGGITKSFLWGNRYYLPFIGIRIGRLDRVNLSIQFPRSINLNLPVSNRAVFSLYTKPQGGMYIFSNQDSLYFNTNVESFHFTRYELNTGCRVDLRIKQVNFYAALGLSTHNNITFYSEKRNSSKVASYNTYFYRKNLPASAFLNVGLVIKLGKTRSMYLNRNLYDAVDLNSTAGLPNQNAQIPIPAKKTPEKINLESIQDLIDYNDF